MPGVVGKAQLFNGIDSREIIAADNVPALNKSFTIDLWFCPAAFPKCECPFVCRQDTHKVGGFSLWLDMRGYVHFKVACAGEWVETVAAEPLKLRKWSRVSCTFHAGNSLRIAINHKEMGHKNIELPCVDMKNYPLWIGRTPVKMPSFLENKEIPIYSSLDGVIDELLIYADHDAYEALLRQPFKQPSAPTMEKRKLPSGPQEPLAFGSWYMPLKYYSSWDEKWRGNTPDVVVGFGKEIPFRVVFWRGISYAPCFVTEKQNWMCNEFIERSKVTGWGCPESMSDKHADFSSVRILENTPARTVVLWRNAPVGVNQKFPYQNEESQWGDWSEETYIFYPDGVGVRRMDVWSDSLDTWYEWCQSLQVLHPDQRPEDVLDGKKIMSVAAMDGRSQTFGWKWESRARQHEPSIPGANIQVTYLKSQWNPFLILDDRPGKNENGSDGPEICRYAGRWSEYSAFPWRNHWPVTQEYIIGRYAAVADAPSHTYTATQYNAPYEKANGRITKLMLCGCTNKDAADLLPLAKSWLRAPQMTCDGEKVDYLLTERTYVIKEARMPLQLELEASPEHPAHGLCLEVKNWGDKTVGSIIVNSKSLKKEDYKVGIHETYEGKTLHLWLNLQTTAKQKIKILGQ